MWLKDAINWISANNELCMVIITAVYVLATIVICIFNGRSASAAKKQLRQNIALQLYDKRKAVLEALRSVDLKKAFYDIKLLFSNEIFEDYMRLCKKHEEYQHTLSLIDQFKQNIRDLFSQEEYDEFEQSEVLAATNDNYEQIYQESKEYIITKEYEQYSGVLTIDYEEESKKAIALHGEIQDMLTKLYHKIENFIKASISL